MDEKDNNDDKTSENNESPEDLKQKYFFAVYSTKGDLTLVQTNLPKPIECELEKVLTQRLQKALLFAGQGAVIIIDYGNKEDSAPPAKATCYYYTQTIETSPDSDEKATQNIICFISDDEESLDLFHNDLDHYCVDLIPQLSSEATGPGGQLSAEVTALLEGWHGNSVEYLTRCRVALQDNLKYLIHSALLSHKLVTSGGTRELQTDLQRFYEACSLSDILRQLKEVKSKQDTGSLSGSIDMLTDVSSGQTDAQTAITVSITEDSLKLDSNGCNRFCEEWANNLNRPEFQNNPAKLKHVIEVFKLKFIQTMNTLKRLLREADNDYYALYRSYKFLRDSGNSDILLHYIMAEADTVTVDVLQVLQEFIQEQQM